MKEYKFSSYCFKFFIFLLLSSFLGFADAHAATEEKTLPDQDQDSKKIVSILQTGVNLIKYEIKRDQSVASRKMLIPGLRQLRIALKNDIGPKEQLINDLKSYLPEKLTGEIRSLQSTLDQEKKIIESNQISPRVKKMTRNIIKKSIPVKENILASFEKVLSELQ